MVEIYFRPLLRRAAALQRIEYHRILQSYTFKNVLFYVVLTLADNYKHYLTMLIKFFLLFCGIRIIWSLPVSELSLNCQPTRPAQIPSQIFATLKRMGNCNRNVSPSCFWDRYRGRASQLLAIFSCPW